MYCLWGQKRGKEYWYWAHSVLRMSLQLPGRTASLASLPTTSSTTSTLQTRTSLLSQHPILQTHRTQSEQHALVFKELKSPVCDAIPSYPWRSLMGTSWDCPLTCESTGRPALRLLAEDVNCPAQHWLTEWVQRKGQCLYPRSTHLLTYHHDNLIKKKN